MNGYETVAVIVPARDEEEGLSRLLPRLRAQRPGQIIVVDNGSRDGTSAVARRGGAEVVFEPRSGYGSACRAGLRALAARIGVVVFIDADLADDPADLPILVEPVLSQACDLVLSARRAARRERGAMTVPQSFGTWLATRLIRLGWGYVYTDLGPFRAIERAALDRLRLRDRRFGWTVEMQIRAVEEGLRIREVPLAYRRRIGTSKISGTVRGTVLAGYWILRTVGALWLSRGRRRVVGGTPPARPVGGALGRQDRHV